MSGLSFLTRQPVHNMIVTTIANRGEHIDFSNRFGSGFDSIGINMIAKITSV